MYIPQDVADAAAVQAVPPPAEGLQQVPPQPPTPTSPAGETPEAEQVEKSTAAVHGEPPPTDAPLGGPSPAEGDEEDTEDLVGYDQSGRGLSYRNKKLPMAKATDAEPLPTPPVPPLPPSLKKYADQCFPPVPPQPKWWNGTLMEWEATAQESMMAEACR